MRTNTMEVHQKNAEPWEVTLVDTGETTMTGGRLKRVREYLGEQTFCFTYGDGVSDVDITALISHHQSYGRLATVTSVQPPGRFGVLEFGVDASVVAFQEKPHGDGTWINGGFFALEPSVKDFIDNENTIFEKYPLEEISKRESLVAYQHPGFWQCADTIRELELLEKAIKDNGYAENYRAL